MCFLEILNWNDLIFGEHGPSFGLEIIVRTLIMYIVILVGLRLTGKRGVRQLSIFELVVIIGLGSSAGDPMFYKEVGLLTAVIVFIVVISAYRFTTYLTGKSKKVEKLIEGETVCLIKDGVFCYKDFDKEDLAQDEFFSELRTKGVSHIGQVERTYLEVSGEVSVFYYKDEDVKYGLPILPEEFKVKFSEIPATGFYACAFCGHTEKLTVKQKTTCPVCDNHSWVKASNQIRVT